MEKIIQFKWFILAAGLISLILSRCGENKGSAGAASGSEASTIIPMNIIVVLDLSDRIMRPGQIAKDKEIVFSVLDEFEQIVRTQAYIYSQDVFQVVIAKEPGVEVVAEDDLRIDMKNWSDPKLSDSPGFPLFKARKAKFTQALETLYQESSAKPNPGADIYSFFCTELPAKYLQPNTKVIVITDGYLLFIPKYLAGRPQGSYMRNLSELRKSQENWLTYFEQNNLKLSPCTRSLDGVDVMLLETAPEFQGSSVYEFDFVEHYWMTWFNEMNVKASIYPQEQKKGIIQEKISAFLKK